MGVLIESQWRLVRTGCGLWIVATLFETQLRARGGSPFELMSLMPAVLAAGLGARLFASQTSSWPSTWLTGLPLTLERITWTKFGLGLLLLTVGVLLTTIARQMAFAFGHQGVVDEPTWGEWLRQIRLLPTMFVASAFFAVAFERAVDSRLAWAPGCLAGYALSSWGEPAFLPGLASNLFAVVFGVLAIFRLQLRRAADATTPQERMTNEPRAQDWPIVVPAVCALLLLPLLLFSDDGLSKWESFLHWTKAEVLALVWVAFGVLALPWGWRDLRVRGFRGARLAAGLLLIASGVGVFLWRALRPRGAIVACTTCGSRRVTSLSRCPRCGEREANARRWRFRVLPESSVNLAVAVGILMFGGTTLLGGLRYIHLYELHADLPGIELALDGGPGAVNVLRGWETGPPMGTWFGGWIDDGSDDPEHEQPVATPVSLRELGSLVSGRGHWNLGAGVPPVTRSLATAMDADHSLRVSCNGSPCQLTSAWADFTGRAFVVKTNLWLVVECPELENEITELLRSHADGSLTQARMSHAMQWGDALFIRLFQRLPGRRNAGALEFAGARGLIDELLSERYDLRGKDPGPILADLERLGELTRERAGEGRSLFNRELLPYTEAQMCALGRMGSAIEDTLLERIERGDLHCALAAGFGRVTPCYSACEQLLVRYLEMSPYHVEHEAAAWAILSIDGDRAVPFLLSMWDRLEGDERHMFASLLGATGRQDALAWLRSIQDDDSATPQMHEDAHRGLWLHDQGVTLDAYLFF